MSINLPRGTGLSLILWINSIYTDQIHWLLSVQTYKPSHNLKNDSKFQRIIMNALALIVLSLTAIATAAPGDWRVYKG